jgi:hypothetical protein
MVAHMGEMRCAYENVDRKPEGKRPLGRPRHLWKDNIKTDHKEIGWERVDCINLAKDSDRWRAFVNTVMNLRIP